MPLEGSLLLTAATFLVLHCDSGALIIDLNLVSDDIGAISANREHQEIGESKVTERKNIFLFQYVKVSSGYPFTDTLANRATLARRASAAYADIRSRRGTGVH